jgi:serine/threonine protein kinase
MIHQDVKPSNMLIDARGKCFLFDFGLAVTRTDSLKLRAGGGLQRRVGTGSFRAPEQEVRGASVGRSADIYSFGVSLHQMLTGELPQGAALSSALSPEVAGIISSCLAEKPGDRPSAQTLRQQLHGLE